MKIWTKFTDEEIERIREFFRSYNPKNTLHGERPVDDFAATMGRKRCDILQKSRRLGIVPEGLKSSSSIRRSARYWIENQTSHWFTTQRLTTTSRDDLTELFDGRSRSAAKVIWLEERGPIPDGICVQNTCGHPLCLNPYHADLKSRAEISRSRPTTRLTQAKADRIRLLRERGWPLQKIADKYGINQSMVSLITKGRRWVPVTLQQS